MTKVLEDHAHPTFPRLHVQLRSNSKFYQSITHLDGRYQQKSTKVRELPAAFKVAEEWYRRLIRATVVDHPVAALMHNPTVGELFSAYRLTLSKSKQDEALKRWGPIALYWRILLVKDIDAQSFREFYTWRRRQEVGNNTIHKDVTLVRQILKHAIEDNVLSVLPPIPKVGTIETNPRPWLTAAQWKHLMAVSNKRIKSAPNVRTRQQRQDLHDMMVFMVHSMCRVGEMQNVRFQDCRVEKNTDGDKILIAEVTGKRGVRTIVALSGAASVFERRKKGKDASAMMFPEYHRDAFRELLDAAGLRRDNKGFTRNMKSLRATAISLRILNNPELNLTLLARNAGTSTTMIDTFYAKRLTAEMGKDALTKMAR